MSAKQIKHAIIAQRTPLHRELCVCTWSQPIALYMCTWSQYRYCLLFLRCESTYSTIPERAEVHAWTACILR